MAKKNQDGNGEAAEAKYDIPKIIMDMTMSVMPIPEPDEMEELSDDDMFEIMEDSLFMCIFAWNYAVLPADCGEKIMADMQAAFEEDEDMEGWEHSKEIVLDLVEEIREEYADADEIVVNHTLEISDEGALAFNVEIIPLEDAVAAIHEENQD